jgi:DNA-binding YbaB/EbfC family protein
MLMMMNKGFGNIMKQAQKMQEKLLELQEGLGEKTVEATVGGGMVTVVANGRQEVVSIKIEPQVLEDLKTGELEVTMLEDLVASGVNAALAKARELMQQEMAKLTGGLRIPGLF